MTALAELFPDGEHRFHLTLRRGEPREFFRPADSSGALLAERARWLAREPGRYAAATAEAGPLLEEFAALCATWGVADAARLHDGGCEALGAMLEPDVLLLSPDAEGQFRLRGGALCFPTGWALEEKLGRTMDFIHGAVPGLNATLAAPIHQFLARMKPGAAYRRDNWGIAATDELNLHPARGLPPPSPPVAPDRLWLRVEYQALIALPQTRGVAFGIRIALHRLDAIARDPEVAPRLRHALESMPDSLAAYKRIDAIRADLIARL